MAAHLHQERHIELVTGAEERFVITSTMFSAVIPTELPHLFVFVLKLNDRLDPKADTLARVCRISDLTYLPRGRDAGLAADPGTGQEFISTICELSYSTLTEALAGKQAIIDRVNQLIDDWIDFKADFDAPDPFEEDIVLPTADPSQKQVLIDAYAAAKQAGYAQLQVKNAADATLARALADYTYKAQLVTDITPVDAKALVVQNEVSTAATAFSTFKAAGDVFLAAAGCAGGGDQATFQAALNVAANQLTLNTAYLADAVVLKGLTAAYLSSRTTERNTAQTVLATAQADQIAQAQTLTTNDATTVAALAALLAVVPDFPPATVPYVPG